MKSMKKWVALATATAMLTSSVVSAQDDGMAYFDSYGSSNLAPAVAVGAIAIAAVIAVLVNNSNEGAAHTHFHCHD